MSRIVIKKRVSFEFLGDEYKDCYADFQKIPVGDFEGIQEELKEIEKIKGSSYNFVLGVLKKYFQSGKFLVNDKLEEIQKEDLEGLDTESVINCFQVMTGQQIDPKAESPSPTPLPTEATTTK